jgi:hypothetical protein
MAFLSVEEGRIRAWTCPRELLAEREYRIITGAAAFAARDMTVYTFLPALLIT